MSSNQIKPARTELLLARLLSVGTCVASAVIGMGLALSWFSERAAPQLVTAGIGLFILFLSGAIGILSKYWGTP